MSQPPAAPEMTRPEVNYTQEVRFAVVMYGGSSLAIYMNGVAQELLRLVRATAPARDDAGAAAAVAYLPDAGLRGSERVYRKLGRMLVRGDEGDEATVAAKRARRAQESGELRTRFVVDVLTGSSAGGINAVYLAKALANDQSLDKLMELWVTKGDIDVLLNVPASARISVDGREQALDFTGQPLSPLNSSRMYWELLDALRGMDGQAGGAADGLQPLYAEELDLFVTATDTRGRILNMRLADKVVEERHHRNVFRFRYRADGNGNGVGENDFNSKFNPFLAFAARCTSAHQAAFEVMNMESSGAIVAGTGGERPPELNFRDAGLQKFYEQYLLANGNIKATGLAEDFHGRFFNDGGTLDNSPFSFVSEILPFRQTQHPVDRKLLYVEPSPEHPSENDPGNLRLNFIKNAFAGLSSLPSHQTIVEDLTRIQERNRLIERVNHIIVGLRNDIRARNDAAPEQEWPKPRSIGEMRRKKLSQLIQEKGVSWGGYQRLRIGQVTNDLTLLIARAAGIDEESDEFQAVRYLVRYWRRECYDDHVDAHDSSATAEPAGLHPKVPEMGFLIDFDLGWTIRRVQFLLRTIDELDCLDGSAHEIVRAAARRGVEPFWPTSEEDQREFREELRDARDKLNKVYTELRRARREFWARRGATEPANPFVEKVDGLNIPKPSLIDLLNLPSEQARAKEIEKYLWKDGRAAFESLSTEVMHRFRETLDKSRMECGKVLRYQRKKAPVGPRASVRSVLFFYYRFFEDFDQVTFPIFYSTNVGEETDPIEVFRVSPEDAFLLVDEKEVNAQKGRKERIDKLAGTSLFHFGAFFDERYRVNDILWGRLDGAERIISALLPGQENKTQREALVREAHREIILETWERELSKLNAPLAAEVRSVLEGTTGVARGLEGRLASAGVGALWRRYFLRRAGRRDANEVDDFRQAFIDSYQEEREFSPGRKFRLGRMGARVLWRVLRSNLKETSSGKGPAWRVIVGLLLTLGGLVSFLLGLVKLGGGVERWILSPFRRGPAKQTS